MGDQPPAAKDYFLACYTASLVQGKTILGIPTRYTTIKKYLTAAYDLFDKSAAYESEHKFVEIILKSVKDYEDTPKRRRMITDKMMQGLGAVHHGHSYALTLDSWGKMNNDSSAAK